MKLTILFFLITVLGFSQNDILSYQYRFIIKDITSTGSAKFVQEPLVDLFKTVPTYQEGLNTFVFESKEDIQKEDIRKNLPYSYNEIIFFKRSEIKADTLSFTK
jgi:hypothetical protein